MIKGIVIGLLTGTYGVASYVKDIGRFPITLDYTVNSCAQSRVTYCIGCFVLFVSWLLGYSHLKDAVWLLSVGALRKMDHRTVLMGTALAILYVSFFSPFTALCLCITSALRVALRYRLGSPYAAKGSSGFDVLEAGDKRLEAGQGTERDFAFLKMSAGAEICAVAAMIIFY